MKPRLPVPTLLPVEGLEWKGYKLRCGSSLGGMPLSNRVPELAAMDVLVAVGRLGSMGAAGREH